MTEQLDMGTTGSAEPTPIPAHRWAAACYFDFHQERPNTTATEHRAYFRLRSDGRMYYATIPLDYTAHARYAPDSGYWGAIIDAVESQFARWLADDSSIASFTEHEFWQEVGRQQARLGARDPLVMEVVGGHGTAG